MLQDRRLYVSPFCLLILLGCAASATGGDTEGDGTGGSSGGTTVVGSGGAVTSAGGSASAGGSSGTSGGASGVGGGLSTGGTGTSTGGTTAAGGGTSTGGDTGTGGSSGSAWATFDSDLDGFSITYENTAGADTATHDGTTGDPSNGSMELDVKVAGPDEKVFVSGYPASPLDLTGHTITARIKLDSGLSDDESCPGGAYIFAKSGDGYDFARGTWTNLSVSDGWVTLTMDTGDPDYTEGFVASDVREIGVAVSSGGTCGSDPYGAAIVHVDTIAF